MRKLITRSVLATLTVLVMASSASAALIPIAQLEWFEPKFSIINQTGLDSTDDFPVTTLLSFSAVSLDVDGTVLGLGDFDTFLNVLSSQADFLGPLLAQLSGSVAPGIVTLSSGTNAAWNGSWNITTGALVGADGLSPIVLGIPVGSFWETGLIYVDATPVVPEPMTVGLFATGLAGLLVRRRRAARR
jgi:hypothetical protein